MASDRPTGLLRLDHPPGPVRIGVSREATPEERLGRGISAAAVALWLSAAVLRGGRPRSPAGVPAADARGA